MGAIDRLRKPTIPTRLIRLDADGAPFEVTIRKLTRGQINDIQTYIAGLDDETIVPADLFGLLVLAYSFADPDIIQTEGLEGALELLYTQPGDLLLELMAETREWSALDADAPKGSKKS